MLASLGSLFWWVRRPRLPSAVRSPSRNSLFKLCLKTIQVFRYRGVNSDSKAAPAYFAKPAFLRGHPGPCLETYEPFSIHERHPFAKLGPPATWHRFCRQTPSINEGSQLALAKLGPPATWHRYSWHRYSGPNYCTKGDRHLAFAPPMHEPASSVSAPFQPHP